MRGVGTPELSSFAADLRALWLAAGKPSYREISRDLEAASGRFYSKSAIGDVLAGHRLPKRALLVDVVTRLGGDPEAWSARLTDLLQPSVAAVPAPLAHLPHDIREFTGREREVARARELLAGADADTGLPIVVVQGMAGTGKTRLAIHVAHLEEDRFGDLQLYADLRGFSAGEPADPAAVLAGFLRPLGVPGRDLPAGLDDRAALFRARLAGRRALVLLDDAATEEQVRPLLPGSPSCAVLVTSRRALDGLDGAQPLPLGVFPPADSLALLDRVVGADRTAGEPGAAERLADLCGHLPLAVALAGRRLRSRTAWRLADLVRRLEQEERRLAELAVSDLAVRAVFELSYAQLDEPHRRLFRLLALHPGRDCDAWAAAALTGEPLAATAARLETLLDEHLVEQTVPGRYRQHDLLRVFAGDRLAADEDAAGRAAAVRGLLDWCLRTADQAGRLLAPHRRRLPYRTGDRGAELPPMRGYDDALAWCEAEQETLLGAVRLAVGHQHDDVAWQLPVALFPYLETHRAWQTLLDAALLARDAAGRLGDAWAQAWTANGLGIAYVVLGDLDAGRECFGTALAIRERLGDEVGISQVLNNLGELSRRAGDPAAAIRYYTRDLALSRRLGDRQGESVTLNNLGKAQHALGRLDEALATEQEALAAARDVGDRRTEAEIVGDIAEVRTSLGDLPGAARDYELCEQLYARLGDSVGRLTAVLARAELAAAAGDRAGADHLARTVLAGLDGVDEPHAGRLRTRLAALG